MAKKVYQSKKTAQEKQDEIKEIIHSMNEQIDHVTKTPENLVEYLTFMSTFRHYSLRNTLLIQRQFPGAKAVASFTDFKKKGFFVKEKSKIKILCPSTTTSQFKNAEGEWVKLKEASPSEKNQIARGELKVESGMVSYRKGDVFDISQTNAKASDLPKIFPNRWIEGDVKEYEAMIQGLEKVMENLGVAYDWHTQEIGTAKGYYIPSLHVIRLNERNTELQNVKTMIHELAHARLHNNSSHSKQEREFQAELVAVSVCAKFGLDTTEYSLPYLRSWTDGTTLDERKALLDEVYTAAKEMIDTVEPIIMRSRTHELQEEFDLLPEQQEFLKNKILRDEEKLLKAQSSESLNRMYAFHYPTEDGTTISDGTKISFILRVTPTDFQTSHDVLAEYGTKYTTQLKRFEAEKNFQEWVGHESVEVDYSYFNHFEVDVLDEFNQTKRSFVNSKLPSIVFMSGRKFMETQFEEYWTETQGTSSFEEWIKRVASDVKDIDVSGLYAVNKEKNTLTFLKNEGVGLEFIRSELRKEYKNVSFPSPYSEMVDVKNIGTEFLTDLMAFIHENNPSFTQFDEAENKLTIGKDIQYELGVESELLKKNERDRNDTFLTTRTIDVSRELNYLIEEELELTVNEGVFRMTELDRIKAMYKKFVGGESMDSQERTDIMRYDRNATEWERMDMRLAALGELTLDGGSYTEQYDRLEATRGESMALLAIQEKEYQVMAERIMPPRTATGLTSSERKGPFEHLFESMGKRFEKQATFEKEDTNLVLNFQGKIIYYFDSENQEVTKSVVNMHGEWNKAVQSASLEDSTSFHLFSDLMTQSGQMMAQAKLYGIDQDSAFTETDFIQLFKQGLSQKEQFISIQEHRDTTHLERVFSGKMSEFESKEYQEERDNELKEKIKDGHENFQNSEGLEFSVHQSTKEKGIELILVSDDTGVKEKIRLTSPEMKEAYLLEQNVVACTSKSMEFTRKGLEKAQSNEKFEQTTSQNGVVNQFESKESRSR